MNLTRLFPLILSAASLLTLSAQPLITEDMMPQGENIRAGIVFDLDRSITNGDDYHGFTVAYASEIYPLDQMVISYTHLIPEDSTMRQVLLTIEEYYPINDKVSPYGAVGGGYIWTDYDSSFTAASHGWFGKLGAGVLVELNDRYDFFAELAYTVSTEDLWLEGTNGVTSNNTQLLLGVRMNY